MLFYLNFQHKNPHEYTFLSLKYAFNGNEESSNLFNRIVLQRAEILLLKTVKTLVKYQNCYVLTINFHLYIVW